MNGLRLQRNCSASPKLLVAVLGGVSVWTLLIGLGFWAIDVPWVLPFAGLEVLLLLTAFAVHSRRVTDSDTLWLTDTELHIHQQRKGRGQTFAFSRCFVRIDLSEGLQPLVRIQASGQQVLLGHWLRPAARRALCLQLKRQVSTTDPSEGMDRLLQTLQLSGARAVEWPHTPLS